MNYEGCPLMIGSICCFHSKKFLSSSFSVITDGEDVIEAENSLALEVVGEAPRVEAVVVNSTE